MKNRLILCSLLFSSVLLALAMADSGEAEAVAKVSVGQQVQALTLGKHKRQKNPPEEQEAQLMPWAHKLENVTVTYYDCCVACCGKDDGITYSGTRAVPYETCAVDPDVIPLGSAVTVDYGDGELHHYRAEDIGGGVNGNRIDICVSSHGEALELGVKTATVYWMEEDMSEWISTMDRLPDEELYAHQKKYLGENVEIIVMISGAALPTALEWDGSSFWDQNGTAYDVTHWMPFPAPPEET